MKQVVPLFYDSPIMFEVFRYNEDTGRKEPIYFGAVVKYTGDFYLEQGDTVFVEFDRLIENRDYHRNHKGHLVFTTDFEIKTN